MRSFFLLHSERSRLRYKLILTDTAEPIVATD